MNKLPGELVDYKQWVVWRRAEVGGRKTKLPISPWSGKVASCDKPHTWSTFRQPPMRATSIGAMGLVLSSQ